MKNYIFMLLVSVLPNAHAFRTVSEPAILLETIEKAGCIIVKNSQVMIKGYPQDHRYVTISSDKCKFITVLHTQIKIMH